MASTLACDPDHFPMRLVQSAHRGNKYTAFSMRLRLRLGDRRNDPHPRTRVDHGSKYAEIPFSLCIKLRPDNLRMFRGRKIMGFTLIRAKWLAWQSGISCDRNFPIQRAGQDHASQKRRRLEWQRAAHRNGSSARGKSA